ncbi:MAG: 50S ribosomal protein L10 [Candidatus Aminicenantes bacterium]|nr:50S ribosomal protein L10 [Candidatus Aminicenantes bacterium]
MKKEKKTKLIEELNELFARHDTFYVLDFQGMTVAQATRLRKAIRQMGGVFKVIKNRLALRALKADLPAEVKNYFQKPTALAFPDGDPIALARFLKDFSTQNKVLSVKGGVIQGYAFPGGQFDEVCRLSSRGELMAKLAYLTAYPLINLMRTLQAPLAQFGFLLSQLKNKK